MALFKRIGDILTANLNELFDRYEDPERMVKQAVRDLEAILGRVLDAAARAIAQERLLERARAAEQQSIVDAERKARQAVGRGDDDAARAALTRKWEHECQLTRLADEISRSHALAERLRDRVASLRLTLTRARAKQHEVAVRHRATRAERQFASFVSGSATELAILSTIERHSSQVERSAAESEAWLELLGAEADVGQESCADRVDAELQALKASLNHVAT